MVAEAEHFCMKMRGVKNDARMTSHAFRGTFQNRDEKADIVAMIRGQHDF